MSAFPTITGIKGYSAAVVALDKIERASQSLDKSIQNVSMEDAHKIARIAVRCDNVAEELRKLLTEIEAEASKETA